MEQQLNILFLSSWYPNKLDSHLGNFVQRHAQAVSLLHHVEVLYAFGDRNQKEKFVTDVQSIEGVKTIIIYYRKSLNPLINFIRRNKAYKHGFSKVTFPDLVHANILQSHILFAKYLKKKLGIKYIVTEHWSGFFKKNVSSLSWYKVFIAKSIAKDADYIVPVSEALKQDMESLGVGRRFEVVGNVVDTELFFPIFKNSDDDKFVFLHVSNLVGLKNPISIIDSVIEIYRSKPFVRLEIGGDGDYESLIEYVNFKNATDFITVFGKQSLEQVANRMQRSNCFVLFSEYENLPCVLLESMSCGVPVISSNVGGVSEIVDAKCGLLIQLDRKELTDGMIKMIDNSDVFYSPVNLHQMIRDKYSKLQISKRFTTIYNKVLAQNFII